MKCVKGSLKLKEIKGTRNTFPHTKTDLFERTYERVAAMECWKAKKRAKDSRTPAAACLIKNKVTQRLDM